MCPGDLSSESGTIWSLETAPEICEISLKPWGAPSILHNEL